jgi:hypothetical protein
VLLVVALGLPLRGEADHDDGDVRLAGRGFRALHQIRGNRLRQPEAHAPEHRRLLGRVLQHELDAATRFEGQLLALLAGAEAEPGVAAHRIAPAVDRQLAGQEEPCTARALQGEEIGAGLFGREAAPEARREPAHVDALVDVAAPGVVHVRHVAAEDRLTRAVERVEVLALEAGPAARAAGGGGLQHRNLPEAGAARLVAKREAGGLGALLERLEDRDPVVRTDPGAAASEQAGALRVGTDQRDAGPRFGAQRQQAPLVLEQHAAVSGSTPGELPVLGTVDRLLLRLLRGVEGARPLHHAQDPAHLVVELRLGNLPGAHRLGEGLAKEAWRTGHLEVVSAERRTRRALEGVPVGDDEPLEAPLLLQHVDQQRPVLGGEGPVHLVVRRHDGGRRRLANGRLEGLEVDLAQGPLRDLGADRHAFELGIVADVVLDRGPDSLALDALYEADGEPCRQEGILRVALEVTPAER